MNIPVADVVVFVEQESVPMLNRKTKDNYHRNSLLHFLSVDILSTSVVYADNVSASSGVQSSRPNK